MDELQMLRAILDSYPYPVVFVDDAYVIRYLNKNAKYHYYQERGYGDLIGKCLFDCHNNPRTRERIISAYEGMKKDGKDRFVSVNAKNLRIYMQTVRDEGNKVCGFIERFELNLQMPYQPHPPMPVPPEDH